MHNITNPDVVVPSLRYGSIFSLAVLAGAGNIVKVEEPFNQLEVQNFTLRPL
jgi:hypothetical protein